MANEPPTGVLFSSHLGTPEMRAALEATMPGFTWRLGDSDQYSYFYVVGTRPDGVTMKIAPEDDPGEYYLGVYFSDMPVFPEAAAALAIARSVHEEVLATVGGVRHA